MSIKIKKWLAIILFGFSVFVTGWLLIAMSIASVQEQYAKAIWYAICSLGWGFWIAVSYYWYSKNR